MSSPLDTANFKLKEFLCPCCGGGADIVKPELLAALERLRRLSGGIRMVIDSGYRCPKHNRAVGGAKDSAHLIGMAADIRDKNNAVKAVAYRVIILEACGLWSENVAFTPGWFHVQIRPAKERVFTP